MKLLVADSGGTRTDWCLSDQSSEMHFFETVSYHPNQWSEAFFHEQALFWDTYPNKAQIQLFFFGAGCLADDKQEILRKFFSRFGFAAVNISSDVHAAAFATIGAGSGVVAILGTGSVLAEFENGQLNQIHGGLGYLLGDEGSGFYFGKLVLDQLLNGRLPNSAAELHALLGDRKQILTSCYGGEGKMFISKIAERVRDMNSAELEALHKENILLFFQKYSGDLVAHELSFCGSYAFNRQDELKEIAADFGKIIGKVYEKPIRPLTEYLLKQTF
jgi:glucosamine kinase